MSGEIVLIVVSVIVSQGVGSWLTILVTVGKMKVHLGYHKDNIARAQETGDAANKRIDRIIQPSGVQQSKSH